MSPCSALIRDSLVTDGKKYKDPQGGISRGEIFELSVIPTFRTQKIY